MTPPPDPTARAQQLQSWTIALLERLEAEAKLWEPSPLTVLLREAMTVIEEAVRVAIDQRVIGHGEGQEHTIADVNAGRVDDLIAPRLLAAHAQQAEEIARLQERLDVLLAEKASHYCSEHRGPCQRSEQAEAERDAAQKAMSYASNQAHLEWTENQRLRAQLAAVQARTEAVATRLNEEAGDCAQAAARYDMGSFLDECAAALRG